MKLRILSVLFLSLFARIFYFTYNHSIWWDAAVYLSMAKFLASGGTLGLWEPIRPLIWPLLLSVSHLISINDLLWGYALTTVFSIGIIYLTYLIAKNSFGTKVAILSSILISFTWIFFYFNIRLYTEIPSTFFALLGIYFYLRNKNFLSGTSLAIAFLTKYPQGIVFAAIFLLTFKNFKRCMEVTLSFLVTLSPFFLFNYFYYGSFLGHLPFASQIIQNAGIWIFAEPWWYYLSEIFRQNWLYILVIPGIFFSLQRKKIILPLITGLFLLYFSFMEHKELRFAILFLPYLSILASLSYKKLIKSFLLFILITTVFFITLATIDPYYDNPYFTFIDNKELSGEILVTHPLSAYYSPKEVTMMYYPWFNSSQAIYWQNYVVDNYPEIVMIDTCEGGFLCPPNDFLCLEKKENLLKTLNSHYSIIYYLNTSHCEYIIYNVTNS
jgi:hypothetical protein